LLAVLLASCSDAPAPSFDSAAEEFVFGTLALSPVSATQTGYHQHKGVRLDEALDDYSPEGIARQRQFYSEFSDRLAKWDKSALNPEQRADLQIMSDQTAAALLELDKIQSYRHNPTVYVELAGNALFNPLVLEYAPLPDRMRHIIARMQKIPALVEQAKR